MFHSPTNNALASGVALAVVPLPASGKFEDVRLAGGGVSDSGSIFVRVSLAHAELFYIGTLLSGNLAFRIDS